MWSRSFGKRLVLGLFLFLSVSLCLVAQASSSSTPDPTQKASSDQSSSQSINSAFDSLDDSLTLLVQRLGSRKIQSESNKSTIISSQVGLATLGGDLARVEISHGQSTQALAVTSSSLDQSKVSLGNSANVFDSYKADTERELANKGRATIYWRAAAVSLGVGLAGSLVATNKLEGAGGGIALGLVADLIYEGGVALKIWK
jgi:hypothetical protein